MKLSIANLTVSFLVINWNICSPCSNVRGEAHHKRANERADLLGGSQPPPPLLIQAFLPHTVKVHTGTIIWPGGSMGDPHASWNAPHTNLLGPSRTDCALNSPCGNINYEYVQFKDEVMIEQTTSDAWLTLSSRDGLRYTVAPNLVCCALLLIL